MDDARFDALTRTIAQPGSRRRFLGGFAAGVIGLGGFDGADAATCREVGNICREDANCCSGRCGAKDRTGRRRCDCADGQFCPPSNTCCPVGEICASGGGVCCPPSSVCTVGGVPNACCDSPGICQGGVCVV